MATIELDQKIKQAVQAWRERGYEGSSQVTGRLLEFWFKEEHILPDASRFEFWRCQQEGIEALIYIYEVCKYQSLYDLARGFGVSIPVDPTKDRWPKYCFKMATGSGKTWVMALVMVWQYFNRIFGTNNSLRYSSHFLLLAPNLIVLDRLKEAFADNHVFREFPFIPPEWQAGFDLQLIFQSEVIPRTARGILHLTNIQQLYEREAEGAINPLDEALGPKPKREEEAIYDSLREELSSYDDLMVLNDEAHHVHSDDLEWNKVIAYLDSTLKEQNSDGLIMQLDFTATPKDLQGNLFPHIIYDYPLAEAIRDKIVKRPRIGEIENVPEPLGKDFVKKNRLQIDVGLDRLKEIRKDFELTSKKPVLFIMTDVTRNADKVGKYLEGQGYAGRVLVIHTDTKGVITKKDLEKARVTARQIDSPENPYEIIISVMMLKEGWDVRNVCVIVPLRAFDSPVLPEQTLGRGLRRMAPQDETWEETLIVIDHPRFRQLWQAEIDKGELIADFTTAKQAYEPSNLVMVNPEKLQFDIEIPVVEGGLTRTVPDLTRLDITTLPSRLFRLSEIELPKVRYRERDLLEQKIVREKILAFDYTENFSLYLSYICKAITSKTGASSIFVELVPKVKAYIENYLFDQRVEGEDLEVTKKLNYIPIREKLVEIFCGEINVLSKKEEKASILRYFNVSETQAHHTSEPVTRVSKAVFDTMPYSKQSILEKEFIHYLDERDEVLAFTKVLPRRHALHIPYYNQEGYLRYYLPDFVVKEETAMYLVETKGLEGVEVPVKDREALRWCENVTRLSPVPWKYLKVRPKDLETYKSQDFKTLATATIQRL
ncbi:type III restriction enzyme [Candidatus Hakubella thermalkaliphila]|uniref:Type III restriction enzyme n=1 Tax=Candidatus Hakubella thermalkaliphila TaxID=2754717 RepID=A0A6V8P525_9ACTN|nr:DEAD/DEAH box helicase family protein [Candidatus Hakubella thermalkaliphila]GFP27739.1 type III restriction enzyme [Candidatus Hakubella thermalkaliphila]GFP34772.1 type III restriction enzyme [Candidatus Hakubella thermalkaliphila]GFP42022.1 type III restriction enzyme [Candidatus Hakubella thermalkaliphila]